MKRFALSMAALFLSASFAHAILDANNNGMSDVWEKKYNGGVLFPANFTGLGDFDGDGVNNEREAAADTDPKSGQQPNGLPVTEISYVAAVYASPVEPGGSPVLVSPECHVVEFSTVAGKQYRLSASPDLSAGSWADVGQPIIGDGSVIRIACTPTIGGQPAGKYFWSHHITDIDTDSDGLSDSEEHQIGTSAYFSDTNQNGKDDKEELNDGLDPSAATADANCDGIPDNEIYTIVIETLSEYRTQERPSWFEALTGIDNVHRYLTKLYSESYSVSDSPQYQAIGDGSYEVTNTCLDSAGKLSAQPQKIEGTQLGPWLNAHIISLGEGESLEMEYGEITETTTPTTATVMSTTKTWTRPWKVKKNNEIIRSGTETIVETKRTELSDSITTQDLWTRFKSLPWQEDWGGWQRSGPMVVTDPALIDEQTAQYIRDQYASGLTNVYDPISWPDLYNGNCHDTRLTGIRWRWVRFNPQNPGEYEYAAPPAGYSRIYNFFMMKWDADYQTGERPDAGQGLVELKCDGGNPTNNWQNVDTTLFTPYRVEDPWKLASMNFRSGGNTSIFIDGVGGGLQMRKPYIADDGSTNYGYESISTVPREIPTPGVEIYQKDISNDHITISAKVYDSVADVLESTIPQAWVNSRKVDLVAGENSGVCRLLEHSYKLYPGRNEITVTVENELGVHGYETLVVEGDEENGYAVVGEPQRVPRNPTCPVIYFAPGEDSTQFTVKIGEKSIQPAFERMSGGAFGEQWFRTKPFLSIIKPPSATPARISTLPSDKPLFISELADDVTLEVTFPSPTSPTTLHRPQSGVELSSPESVEIKEANTQHPSLSFKARRMGPIPLINASLTTYRQEEAQQDVSATIRTAYQNAYGALAEGAKDSVVSFAVTNLDYKEGYNDMTLRFGDSPYFNH
ncbi:MAG: hypothetical protein H8M99_05390, partial [Gloeobacteraceae cyanobacterium ES-bin-144]|nr:hypothetical protein [Verrucomicrobiales bacterium]